MISMKSTTSDGSVYQVNEGDRLIGHIRVKRALTCDKYLALLYHEGEKEGVGKEFDSPQDALDWIGRTFEQSK